MAIVMCKVSGGVTGTRQAPLKDENGNVRHFDTQDEAEREALRLQMRSLDGNLKADFRYWAEA